MRKITVFIEGGKHTISFDQSIVVDKTATLFVKSASIFWNYDNIKKKVDGVVVYDGYKALQPGFWTFNMIKDEFKIYGDVVLDKSPHDGKCILSSDKLFSLLDLGPLLGFPKDVVIAPNKKVTSPEQANILNGLRFVKIHCEAVDWATSIDTAGKRSDVISTLPVVDTGVKGSVTHYKDIESKVSLQSGIYNEMTFKVSTNNDDTWTGSVLLDIYIL